MMKNVDKTELKANAKELLAQPDIDGGLIGGASLKADFFNFVRVWGIS